MSTDPNSTDQTGTDQTGTDPTEQHFAEEAPQVGESTDDAAAQLTDDPAQDASGTPAPASQDASAARPDGERAEQ